MRRAPGILVAVSMIVGRAYAQSASGSIAEQLFEQARELARANRWADACPKFEASLRYDPALGTRLNLAACYEHIGKLASAWTLYRESIDLAKKADDTRRRDYAAGKAAALEPRLARLTITAPATPPAGFAVTRDGTSIEPGALGVALYIDAGPHEITASAPGFEVFAKTVAILDGKAEAVAIPPLTRKPDASVATGDETGIEPTDRPGKPVAPRSRTRLYTAVGAGGVGVVALGVGVVFGAKARSTYGEATALCGDDLLCNSENYPRSRELVSDARSTATLSTVLVIGGVAAIAAGAVVYLTVPRAAERATARLVPVIHGGGTGLAIEGRF